MLLYDAGVRKFNVVLLLIPLLTPPIAKVLIVP